MIEVRECGVGEWADEIAERHGFVATDHHVEITGLCRDCR